MTKYQAGAEALYAGTAVQPHPQLDLLQHLHGLAQPPTPITRDSRGDFIKDAQNARSIRSFANVRSLWAVLKHLRELGACEEAIAAATQLWAEYEADAIRYGWIPSPALAEVRAAPAPRPSASQSASRLGDRILKAGICASISADKCFHGGNVMPRETLTEGSADVSKGPGRVERVIASAFADAAPMEVLTTERLARRAYGVERVEKKHRVAVLRAVRKMDLAIPIDGLRGLAAPTDWIEIRNACNWTYGALEGYCGTRWERRADADERGRQWRARFRERLGLKQ